MAAAADLKPREGFANSETRLCSGILPRPGLTINWVFFLKVGMVYLMEHIRDASILWFFLGEEGV